MWIELKKQLPTTCRKVIICTDKGNISTGHLSKRFENLWTIDDKEFSNEIVIAWQPLPESLVLSNGISCDTAKSTYPTLEDFNKEEKDIGDVAYIECMDHIKKTIREFLLKDEILLEVYSALTDGVNNFLSENIEEISEQIGKQIGDKFNIEVNLNMKKTR